MKDQKHGAPARDLMQAALSDEIIELASVLRDVRLARLDLLRQPRALAELKQHIKAMPRREARVLRKLLADDLRLMRRADRAATTMSFA